MSSQQRPLPPPPPDYHPQQPQTRKPDRSGRAPKAAAILIVLLLLFMLLFSPLGPMILGPLMGNAYAESSSFTLTRTVEIEIEGGSIQYACDLPVPGDLPGAQDIIETDTLPTASTVYKYGTQWVEWTGGGTGLIQLSISCQAEVNTIVWDIDSTSSGTIGQMPSGLDHQMDNEWEIKDQNGDSTGEYKIWPQHPTIQSLASSLTRESATVYENVESIYDYVRQNIKYQTLTGSEPKSCLQTLDDGKGDCDDQSILLISLCRAAGIPSWLAFGTLYDKVTDQWGPHAWAEVCIPLSDGGSENAAIDPANGEFLVRNCNRLEEWKSDGDGEHLNDYYHVLSYNYSIIGNQPAPAVSLNESHSGNYSDAGSVIGCIEVFIAREY